MISTDSAAAKLGSRGLWHAAWFAPFSLSTGLLPLSLSSHLAAPYLTVEAHDCKLQDDFRQRALFSYRASVFAAILT